MSRYVDSLAGFGRLVDRFDGAHVDEAVLAVGADGLAGEYLIGEVLELDYGYIFETLDDAGYEGVISCEFTPTGDPDVAIEDVVALADRVRS